MVGRVFVVKHIVTNRMKGLLAAINCKGGGKIARAASHQVAFAFFRSVTSMSPVPLQAQRPCSLPWRRYFKWRFAGSLACCGQRLFQNVRCSNAPCQFGIALGRLPSSCRGWRACLCNAQWGRRGQVLLRQQPKL